MSSNLCIINIPKQMKLILIFLLLTSTQIFASINNISGTIKDKESEETLPFASISITNNKGGTISNRDGNFNLGVSKIDQSDSIIFSYMGYKNFVLKPADIKSNMTIYLEPIAFEITEIAVLPNQMSAKDIIDSVKFYFEKNVKHGNFQKEIFARKYNKDSLSEAPIVLKKIAYNQFDSNLIESMLSEISLDKIEYQDALVNTFTYGNEAKLLPKEAISLDEKEDFSEEINEKLDLFVKEFKENAKDPKTYFKIRSGIFAAKLNFSENSLMISLGGKKKKNDSIDSDIQPKQIECESDSAYFSTKTQNLKNNILGRIEYNSYIENIPILNSTNKYKFKLDGISSFKNEPVYQISFTPKMRGVYKGNIYISKNNFAVHQIDLEYGENKHGQKINLLGISYLEKYEKLKMIFESAEDYYFLKYMYEETVNDVSIERNLTLNKKEKRFIGGKTTDKMKFDLQFKSQTTSKSEVLVINNEPIDSTQFNSIHEAPCTQFKKVFGYTPEMWENNSIIAPSEDLKAYKRKNKENTNNL